MLFSVLDLFKIIMHHLYFSCSRPLVARFSVQLFLTCLSCLLEMTNTVFQDMGLLCVERRILQV